jgi:ABC transport system ATP-binding/permease protein
MSEPILNALMQLFALICDIHDDTVITSRGKEIVRLFLTRLLNNELVIKYMKLFEVYLALYNSQRIIKGSVQDRKRTSLNSIKILGICEKINEELRQNQKIYVLIQLIDFISSGDRISENEMEFLSTVSNAFNVPEHEYDEIRIFIMGTVDEIPDKSRVLVISSETDHDNTRFKHLYKENLDGVLEFLHIESTNIYIMRYSGNEDIHLNGQNISSGITYIFDRGSSIRGAGITPVYYTEIVSVISEASFESRITLDARNVWFRFRNSENGIHDLNIHEGSGRLVGILGGSGAGKSTTLSILNGTLKPQSGKVLINGYDLYDEKEKEHLKGVIGFVPQDDLLVEELTVYQNLYYNAKMCLNNLPENKIIEVVNKTINDFDLEETRDLKVGNPLNKVISGGQRKRINIALELLREPTILFVDEPTSGLSSVDSEIVMNLLKEQTYKGKLVIVNIHQPCSDLYKMFDKIMIIDKGGYQIYYGNPSEAIVYFKIHTDHVNPHEDQCIKCGNINTDQILQIIEAKILDEYGKPTRFRRVTPKEWAQRYRKEIPPLKDTGTTEKQKIPENSFSIPGLFKQTRIFFIRDSLSKLADKQYILISLLGSPLLAFLLAYFTRYTRPGHEYIYRDNLNIPAYLFMCVITSLFFGLMISSEEIVKDRKILKRESFLNLSWFSYLNSKIMILFILSAIQTISFVLIGNLILEIKGMTLSYWLVLFTTSCFANILGLNISSAFNSVITIYILIPFILIPQLLFSGVLVKFDKLHLSAYSSREYVPVIGDLMAARWSFEALAVRQFTNNDYESNFIKYRIKANQADFYGSYLIDALMVDSYYCLKHKNEIDNRMRVESNFRKLNYYIDKLSPLAGRVPGLWKKDLNIQEYDSLCQKESFNKYLDTLKRDFRKKADISKIEDSVNRSVIAKYGPDRPGYLRDNYENEELSSLTLDLLNSAKGINLIETDNKIIQKYKPGYMKATSKLGRAHFFAPYKFLGNWEIDTFWFNLMVLWLVSIVLYIVLYFNLIRRLLTLIEHLRLKKSDE